MKKQPIEEETEFAVEAAPLTLDSPVSGATITNEQVLLSWTISPSMGVVQEVHVEVHQAGSQRPFYSWTCLGPASQHLVGDADSGGTVHWYRAQGEQSRRLPPGTYEVRLLVAGAARTVSVIGAFSVAGGTADPGVDAASEE